MNLRSCSKETFMIVYGSKVFHRGSFTVRDPFSSFTFLSYTFMHLRGPHKQLRDSRKKRTIVHRVYHFPRFFTTRLLSPMGAGSFFEVTTHLVRTAFHADILWDALKRGDGGLCITITA